MTIEKRQPTDLVPVQPPVRERVRQHLVARRATAVVVARKHAWTSWRIAKQLPMTAFLLVVYSPRGGCRLVAAWVRYLRDVDTSELRAHHAGAKETPDYERASKARAANLRARLLGSALVAVPVLVLALAWLAPSVLGWLAAGVVLVAAAKVLPKREWWEIAIPPAAAWFAWRYVPDLAVLVPLPPAWLVTVLAALAVVVCGWHGRPIARPLVTMPWPEQGGRVPKLTAPMVTAALCELGNSKMKDPDSIRLLSDPIRCGGQGYQIDLELPGSVPASFVGSKREEFAAALRREIGCVWPSVGRRHPGHLVVYVGDEPMAEQDQAPWPLARGVRVDIFTALPMATDMRGDWVHLTFAYSSMVIGAVPRMGKTFWLRQALVACALDPRVRIAALDGKGTGDLAPLAPVTHFYSRGRRPEEIERVRALVADLRAELVRRSDFLDSLSEEECPENKVTSDLVSRYPDRLAPWVVGVDETQSYFEYGDDGNKDHKKIRQELAAGFSELVKLAPALGIIVLLASQNVTATTIPRPISTNVVIRACLKIGDQIANDQILGTSSYKKGIDATVFDFDDKGVLYLAADGARPQIVRSAAGLDAKAAKAIVAKARALRAAAGTLADDEPADAELVLDLAADVRRVMADHGAHAAHLADLVEWLQQLRPDYELLDVDELGKRLRNARPPVLVDQVWAHGRNRQGVDLRKQGRQQ